MTLREAFELQVDTGNKTSFRPFKIRLLQAVQPKKHQSVFNDALDVFFWQFLFLAFWELSLGLFL